MSYFNAVPIHHHKVVNNVKTSSQREPQGFKLLNLRGRIKLEEWSKKKNNNTNHTNNQNLNENEESSDNNPSDPSSSESTKKNNKKEEDLLNGPTFDEVKSQYDAQVYNLTEAITSTETRIKKADYRLKLMSQWKMDKIVTENKENNTNHNNNNNNSKEDQNSELSLQTRYLSTISNPTTMSNILTEATKVSKIHTLIRTAVLRHYLRVFKLKKLLRLIHKQFFDIVGNYLNLKWDTTIENNVRVQNEIDSWYNQARTIRSKIMNTINNTKGKEYNDVALDLCSSLKDIGDIMRMVLEELINRQSICRQVYTSFYNRNKQIQLETHSIQLDCENKKKATSVLKQQLEDIELQYDNLKIEYNNIEKDIESHSLNEKKLTAKLAKQLKDAEKQRADERRNIAVEADIQRRLQLKAEAEKKLANKNKLLIVKDNANYNEYIAEKAKKNQKFMQNWIEISNSGNHEHITTQQHHRANSINNHNHNNNNNKPKIKILPYKFQRNKITGAIEEIPIQIDNNHKNTEETIQNEKQHGSDGNNNNNNNNPNSDESKNHSNSSRGTHAETLFIRRENSNVINNLGNQTHRPNTAITFGGIQSPNSSMIHRPNTAATVSNNNNNYSAPLTELISLINKPLILKSNNSNSSLIGGITRSRREKFVEKLKQSPLLQHSNIEEKYIGKTEIINKISGSRPSTATDNATTRKQVKIVQSTSNNINDNNSNNSRNIYNQQDTNRPHSARH